SSRACVWVPLFSYLVRSACRERGRHAATRTDSPVHGTRDALRVHHPVHLAPKRTSPHSVASTECNRGVPARYHLDLARCRLDPTYANHLRPPRSICCAQPHTDLCRPPFH